MFFDCFKDPILIILMVAAVVSLIVNSISHPTEARPSRCAFAMSPVYCSFASAFVRVSSTALPS